MPSYGEKQVPAGKKKMCNHNYYKGAPGARVMKSRDVNIISDLEVDNIMYKGNTVLRANQ